MKKSLFSESTLSLGRPQASEQDRCGNHVDEASEFGVDPLELSEIQRNLAVDLLSASDLRECLSLLLASALSLGGFDCGGIYLCDESTGGLDLVAHQGLSAAFVEQVAYYPADSENTRLVMAGNLVYDLRSSLPPKIAIMLDQEGLEAIAVIPLRDRGRVIAALNVSSHSHPQIETASRIALEHLVALGEVAIGRLRASEAQIQAERQLRVVVEGANEVLERRVAQRTQELDAAHAMLWTKSRRLELALKASQAGTWEVTAEGEELIWDTRSREIFGYSADELITFDHCMARIHPEDLPGMLSQFQKSFQPGFGDDWYIEFRIIHPVLGIRWMLGLGRVTRDESGHALRMSGINIDITERKRIEQSLSESEEKYRSLHESMMDAFVLVDMNGRILEFNRSYQEMLGYSDEETVRLTYVDITPEKWHDIESRLVVEQIIPQGYSQTYEKEYIRKDGTILPVELRTFLIRDANGEPSSMWAIVRDITERKQAEKIMREWSETLEQQVAMRTLELQQSEARCKQLAEATFEGVMISEGGILLDGNCLLAEMFGYELADMIGRVILDFVAPESRIAVAERFRTHDESFGEFSVLRKDGSTFPLEVRTRILIEGERTIRVSALRDLTATKAEAARMHEQRAELEQAQRLALVSEICAGIIHQIGQPLSTLGMNLSAAIADLESCQIRACQSMDILGDVATDVTRMREIVNHLRSLGDSAHAVRIDTNLNDVIAGALPLLRSDMEKIRIAIKVELDENLPLVKMDSVQMSQVVLNLVRNAMEACADSATEQRVVKVQTRALGQDGVEMNVRDRGAGITEDTMARLFSPFFTTKSDGLGVGLRLSRTIVQAHGGSITGENNVEGGGATFRVFLPSKKSDNYAKV